MLHPVRGYGKRIAFGISCARQSGFSSFPRRVCSMEVSPGLADDSTGRCLASLDGRLVVAACRSGGSHGIGFQGSLPWPRLRDDLRHFAHLTRGSAVVMGRLTFESLPEKSRPLPDRLNIVLSSKTRDTLNLPNEVLLAGSLEGAEELMRAHSVKMPFFVIGGASLYEQALGRRTWSSRVYFTEVKASFDCDTTLEYDFDGCQSDFELVSVSGAHRDSGVDYVFKEYIRRDPPAESQEQLSPAGRGEAAPPGRASVDTATMLSRPAPFHGPSLTHAEDQYLSLIRRILDSGVPRGDRTGVGTRALFGETMRFDLRVSFPLLTTKRVFWRGVAEELLWFVSGSTNANELREKGIHIWDGNGSREYLDNNGFQDRQEGDLGPVYGFQWRHFGAKYVDMLADYAGQGVDQLAEVINTIRTKPTDRRMIISAWNVSALKEMALPPCHLLAQFFVANGELSCMMYQRSCDVGLGVPFNIASYALLTRMIAHVTGLKPGDFVHVLGDAHVYNNHVDALQEQIKREPRPFPTLKIRSRDDLTDIDDFVMEDFEISGYNPHSSIKMKMAV